MILAGPPNNHTHTSGRWTSAPWTRRTLHTAPAGRKLQTWSSFFGFFHATYCSSLFNGAIASAHWRIQLASIEYCGIMRLAQPLYALVYKVLVGEWCSSDRLYKSTKNQSFSHEQCRQTNTIAAQAIALYYEPSGRWATHRRWWSRTDNQGDTKHWALLICNNIEL